MIKCTSIVCTLSIVFFFFQQMTENITDTMGSKTVFLEDIEEITPNEDWPTIPEFFKGKSIFLTGGTGFMGKVLIEKMLWSCPDLDCIYILLRPKRGKDSHQRLIDLEKSKLFERLRIRDPNFFLNKVKVINGDVTEIGLGLSPEEKQILIDSVSIVYHMAASVRFDDSLKEATIMNARGSREIMLLCQEMKQISVIIHVSTTYCNTNKDPVNEKLYPARADWKKTIEIAEKSDNYVLQILTEKYLSSLPNTYVFTKGLAEHVVNELRHNIPTVICRPSIVVPTLSEPIPGWLDNFNGPVGLMIACGKGIMRIVCSDPDVRADFIPVDMAIKGMIIAAWKHGIGKSVGPNIPVYNCCSSLVQNLSFGKLIQLGITISKKNPLNDCLWLPGGGFTSYKTVYYIKFYLFQLLPAIILDLILKFKNRKPVLFKIQRKLYSATAALEFFIDNEFLFTNDKFVRLSSNLLKSDVESFVFDVNDFVPMPFLFTAMMGARRYLLNEPDDTLPRARAHYRKMYIIDKMVKIVFWIIVIWCLYKSTFVKNIINQTMGTLFGTNIL